MISKRISRKSCKRAWQGLGRRGASKNLYEWSKELNVPSKDALLQFIFLFLEKLQVPKLDGLFWKIKNSARKRFEELGN